MPELHLLLLSCSEGITCCTFSCMLNYYSEGVWWVKASFFTLDLKCIYGMDVLSV